MNAQKLRFFLKSTMPVILLVIGNAAVAQTVVYTDQTAFLKQVKPGYYLETFDSLPSFYSLLQPAFYSAKGFRYNVNAQYGGSDNLGLFSVTPDSNKPNDVALSTQDFNAAITLTFTSNNVTAIGGDFFQTDNPGNAIVGDVILTLNDGTTKTLTANIGNLQPFVGFISTKPLTSLVLTFPATGNYATINNFVVGTAVPEPSSWALLVGVGCTSGFCLLRRSRRRK